MAGPSTNASELNADAADFDAADFDEADFGTTDSAAAAPRAVADKTGIFADQQIIAAERVAFLSLAAELAKGRRVLVVDDGASSLSGIAAHLDSVSSAEIDGQAGGGYEMAVADLSTEEAASAASAEALAESLDTAGFVLVRIPNAPGFAPFRERFAGTFSNCVELRQANWVASAVLTDKLFTAADPGRAAATTLRKGADAVAGEELYTIFAATNADLPKLRPHVALTRSRSLRDLHEELDRVREAAQLSSVESEARAAALEDTIRELQEQLAWYDEWELNLRDEIEKRGWAMTLLKTWARFVTLTKRAKSVLGR
ncbi:MAG: hypothetical protein HY827_00195 [Actinobacteria bacterium]|nr:hypothetical protein [Actinomycetota bacterium]